MKLATYVRKLKDRSGNYIVPATRSTGVYLSNNQTLQSWIDNIDSRVDALEENVSSSISLLDCYPIGAIYQSWENTSPASLFGGSWVQIQNQFLYASGNKALGTYGGEEFHTLSWNEMPVHTHTITTYVRSEAASGSGRFTPSEGLGTGADYWSTNFNRIDNAGSGWAHNNMPPYLVVNIWRRTA